MSWLAITDVSRRFGDVTALEDVSIDIDQNEFFSLLGPSGCGKTTLLRILAGLDHPDSGTVTLEGANLVEMPAHRRPVNLMFQSYALFPHLNVERNVAYGLQREGRPKAEIRSRVGEALETVGLSGLERRRIDALSGGQRQRVALARAIVKRPKLLLLDEPLGALDKQIRTQMQRELKRLQHDVGITFVVVTHDQEEAMSMADRIAVLRDGHVEQIADPHTLFDRPATRFVAEFIGRTNLFTPPDRELSVRPERMTIVTDIDGEADDRRLGRGDATVRTLRGTVDDTQFYGGITHATVKVDDATAASLGAPASLVIATIDPVDIHQGQHVVVAWSSADEAEIPKRGTQP